MAKAEPSQELAIHHGPNSNGWSIVQQLGTWPKAALHSLTNNYSSLNFAFTGNMLLVDSGHYCVSNRS